MSSSTSTSAARGPLPLLLAVLGFVAACGGGGSSGDATPALPDASDVVASDVPADAAEVLPEPTILVQSVDGPITGLAKGQWAAFSYEFPSLPVDAKYTHVLNFIPEAFLPPWDEPLPSFGPLVLFSDDLDVLVFSPMEHFFASLVTFEDGAIRYGLSGDLEELPDGFTQRWVKVEGKGMAATILRWGDVLLADRDRARTDRYADTGLSRLGYWTDNGAAYYYKPAPGLTAEETLLAVKAEADSLGIPYGYVQLDSWWYEKEDVDAISGLITGGVTAWRPQPALFPDGLAAFRQRLGLPLVAHNKWFATENSYQAEHPFVVGDKCSLPLDRGPFDVFMQSCVDWGIETYEQDWLWNQYSYLPWLRQRVERAEQWMADLTGAAAARGLTMQECMPSGAHLMDTIDRPVVTTIRTSTDYKSDVSKETWWPQFHTVNLLAYAVGLLPFKDNFRSADVRGFEEALVSILSAGMVGPSDALGASVPAILRATCRDDGLLLKPDRPAFPLDAMFLPHQRPYTVATVSHRPGLGTWHYLAAFLFASAHPERTAMDKTWAAISYAGRDVAKMFVFPTEVTDWHVDLARELGARGRYVAWDWRAGTAAEVEGTLELAPAEHLYEARYVVLAPVLSNDLALLGEAAKVVTLADRRFTSIEVLPDALSIALEGAPGERVTLQAWDARTDRLLDPVVATLGADGTAAVSVSR
jgi:hypothetical protein